MHELDTKMPQHMSLSKNLLLLCRYMNYCMTSEIVAWKPVAPFASYQVG